ncbi:MAG: NlpC/P60 family protein [Sphingobium limneticum]
MTAAHWARPYVGMPYVDHGRDAHGCDCWGGVRLVLRDVFGHDLPSYGELYVSGSHQPSVTATVTTGLEEQFCDVTRRDEDGRIIPRSSEGDMVILRIGGRPWHCGILVSDELFLHWPEGMTACIERLNSAMWLRRISGFYRVLGT